MDEQNRIFAEIDKEFRAAFALPCETLQARIEQNDLIMDLARKHRRALDFMAGVPVQPAMLFGEGVLIGVGQ